MRLIAFFIISWAVLSSAAAAESLTGVRAQVAGPDTHVSVLRTAPGPGPKIFQIAGQTPRIVMDWVQADIKLVPAAKGSLGHVQNIRHSRQGGQGLRVVFDLLPGAKLVSHQVSPGQIDLHVRGPSLAPAAVKPAALQAATYKAAPAQPRYFENTLPYPRLQPSRLASVQPAPKTAVKMAVKKRKPVIVIDAGHGGRDPGSIGRSGTHEKLITLKAALELKKQLLATGRYQVILTRGDDTYIAHEKRIRIARAGQGDLFISIHADSTKGNTARGASVYTLADRAKKRSKGIVNSQNWIMDVDLTEQSDPVGDILVDLAQRKTTSQSELFADMLLSKLSQSTRLVGNSHRRAGYFVLLAPDVPAVLLELGFLSNSQDEALLKSASHRKKVMRSVVTAINGYFATQKP